MHHRALQNQCPSNSDLPTDMLGYRAENRSQMLGYDNIAHCCTIICQTIGYIRLDTVAIPGCLSIDTVGSLNGSLWYCCGRSKHSAVAWAIETYASKYAMKYAMPRYIQ